MPSQARARCALCPTDLADNNRSWEHVIANAIGGRLTVGGFLCKPCNDRTGYLWDAVLAAQLNGLSVMCGVTRERGAPRPHRVTTTAGEDFEIRPEGGMVAARPTFVETRAEGSVQVNFSARTMAEAQGMLAGLQRKYPKLDPEMLQASLKAETDYPKGAIKEQFSVDGPHAGRSVVKSALAMAVHAGLALENCAEALGYLTHADLEACFGFYYQDDPVVERPVGLPLHCVSIRADPAGGLVLGYVEFFGVHRMVVCLGRNYRGPLIQSTYALDPRSGETLDLVVDLKVDAADVRPIFDYERIPPGSMEAAFSPVLALALKRQMDQEQERAIDAAVRYAFAHCGAQEGDVLTDEQVVRLGALVSEHLTPFLARRILGPGRVPPEWTGLPLQGS
jgi:uncharacterized protein (DUF433 family)